jgi:hypothetical protein
VSAAKKYQITNTKWFDKLTTLSKVEGQITMTEIQIYKRDTDKNGLHRYFLVFASMTELRTSFSKDLWRSVQICVLFSNIANKLSTRCRQAPNCHRHMYRKKISSF